MNLFFKLKTQAYY